MGQHDFLLVDPPTRGIIARALQKKREKHFGDSTIGSWAPGRWAVIGKRC